MSGKTTAAPAKKTTVKNDKKTAKNAVFLCIKSIKIYF